MHVLAQQTPAAIQESRLKLFNKLCNFSRKFLIPSSGCLIFNSHWKCKHLHLKPNESSSNCHPTGNSLKNSYEINCEFIKMGLKWRGNGVRNSCRILLIKWHIRYEWRSPTLCTTPPKQTEGYANNWNHPRTHTRKGTWAGRVLIGFMRLPKQREQLEPGNGYGGSSTPACPLTHHLKYKKGANLAVEWSQPTNKNQQKKKKNEETQHEQQQETGKHATSFSHSLTCAHWVYRHAPQPAGTSSPRAAKVEVIPAAHNSRPQF